jgi:hypothetical protein
MLGSHVDKHGMLAEFLAAMCFVSFLNTRNSTVEDQVKRWRSKLGSARKSMASTVTSTIADKRRGKVMSADLTEEEQEGDTAGDLEANCSSVAAAGEEVTAFNDLHRVILTSRHAGAHSYGSPNSSHEEVRRYDLESDGLTDLVPGSADDFSCPANDLLWHSLCNAFASSFDFVVIALVCLTATSSASLINAAYVLIGMVMFHQRHRSSSKAGEAMMVRLCLFNWLDLLVQVLVQMPLVGFQRLGIQNPYCTVGTKNCMSAAHFIGFQPANLIIFAEWMHSQTIATPGYPPGSPSPSPFASFNCSSPRIAGTAAVQSGDTAGGFVPEVHHDLAQRCSKGELFPEFWYGRWWRVAVFVFAAVQLHVYRSPEYRVFVCEARRRHTAPWKRRGEIWRKRCDVCQI